MVWSEWSMYVGIVELYMYGLGLRSQKESAEKVKLLDSLP